MRKTAWGVLWRSDNRLDGKREFLMGCAYNNNSQIIGVISPAGGAQDTLTFRTRREAREFIVDNYSYIRERKDLRNEPHGWKMPKVVKVLITVEPLPTPHKETEE